MTEKKHSLKELILRLWPYALLAVGAMALVLRSRLSFCWSDESFYFSTTDRLLRGDQIFVHEWFPTQLVSIILLPFQLIYRMAAGTNDGIILYFRILFVIFSLCLSILAFRILRPAHHAAVSILCALWIEFYAHLGIATLSYYTLSSGLFTMSMLLIYSTMTRSITPRQRRIRLISSGMLFSLSVLSLPTLCVPYFAFMAAFFVCIPFMKGRLRGLLSCIGEHFAGIAVMALAVLAYVLPTAGLYGIIDNLGHVLSDEEHRTSLVYPFKNFFISVYDVFGKKWVIAAVLLFVCGLILTLKKVRKHLGDVVAAAACWVIFAADFLLFLKNLHAALGHTGFAATALLLFALPVFALTPGEKRNLKLFVLLFLGGMVFSMTYSYSSLCDLYVLSIGHNISAIAGIVFISDYAAHLASALPVLTSSDAPAEMGGVAENATCKPGAVAETATCQPAGRRSALPTFSPRRPGDKKTRAACLVPGALCVAVIVTCTLMTIVLRFTNVYRDAPVPKLTELITEGPAKGLYTTPGHKESYNAVLSDIREYCSGEGCVFFTKLLPWGYLSAGMKAGALTTWRTPLSSERLMQYYELHPDRIPDIVFVMDPDTGSYESCGDVAADPEPNANPFEGPVADMLLRNYTPHRARSCTIYMRKQ